MPDAPDFYHQKTDDELLFFVRNPSYYATELVAAAHQELHRRGVDAAGAAGAPVAPAAEVPAPIYYSPPTVPAAVPAGSAVPWRALVLGVLVLGLGGGSYWLKQRSDAATAAALARQEAARHKAPPRLTEETTSAIPNYDGAVARAVAQQVAKLPAAERADAHAVRQYSELARRFWAAETQTEYLTTQAHTDKAGPIFSDQAHLVRDTWQQWNHALAYGYQFGPATTAQLKRMKEAASNQQHVLADLPALLPEHRFLTDKDFAAREVDVQDLLSGLLPASPVTGKPYKALVLRAPM